MHNWTKYSFFSPSFSYRILYLSHLCTGGYIGRTGGRSSKIWGGGRSMHPSSNILRITVIGCKAKYELEMCSWWNSGCEIGVFGKEKGSYLLFSWKLDKRPQQPLNTGRWLKRSFLGVKRNSLPKKGHSKIWSEKFLSVPQTRCQVSAHASLAFT